MIEFLLEADGIILNYGNRNILSNVYVQCKTGEIVALLGRNGSGKSSLLKIIFGTLQAESQSTRINKKYYSKLHTTNGNIRFLPQSGMLPGSLKIKKAISLFVEHCCHAIFFKDPYLSPQIEEKVETLSGGLRKYLECLLILYSNVKFVLLDEPFTHLTPVMIDTLKEHLLRQSPGKGIILSDHLYQSVIEVSHRIYLIDQGSTYSIKQKEDLISRGYINQ